MLREVDIEVPVDCVEILLKIAEAHLVVVFKLAKVVGPLLYGVVCEVNEFVFEVVDVELATAGSDVAVFVEVCLEAIVNAGHQAKDAKVKFPSIY